MMPSDFPFALGQYNSGFPRYNYAELLQIGRPGALGRMSTGMLTADLFGTPQQISNGSALGKQSAAANDVAAAGRASALPATGVERIALPVLVAVLMLASVRIPWIDHQEADPRLSRVGLLLFSCSSPRRRYVAWQ
jgi:hypothetical protein